MKSASPELRPGAGRLSRAGKDILLILGGMLLLVAALSMYFGSSHLISADERAELPVTLVPGQEVRVRFVTLARSELVIELVLNRHEGVPDDVLDAALFGETDPLNIEWQVCVMDRQTSPAVPRTCAHFTAVVQRPEPRDSVASCRETVESMSSWRWFTPTGPSSPDPGPAFASDPTVPPP